MGAEESKGPLHCLLLYVMGKAVDLNAFDRGQILMTRRLGTSIPKTARLVGCLRSTIVSTYTPDLNRIDQVWDAI